MLQNAQIIPLGSWIEHHNLLHKRSGQQGFQTCKYDLSPYGCIQNKDSRQHLGIKFCRFPRTRGIPMDAFLIALTDVMIPLQVHESDPLGQSSRPACHMIQSLKHPFQKVPKWPILVGYFGNFGLMKAGNALHHEYSAVGIGMCKLHAIVVIE